MTHEYEGGIDAAWISGLVDEMILMFFMEMGDPQWTEHFGEDHKCSFVC